MDSKAQLTVDIIAKLDVKNRTEAALLVARYGAA